MKELLDKLEALGPSKRWMLLGGIVCLLAIGYYFLIHVNNAEQIETLRTEVGELKKSVREHQAIAARYDELKASLAELEAALKVALTFLPETREIPELLTQVSRLGIDSGLEFRLFKPEAEKRRDFYAEVPVSLSILGKFHEVATFFDHLSKLTRIVNVTDIKITHSKRDATEAILITDGLLTTFRFLESGEAGDKKGEKKADQKR